MASFARVSCAWLAAAVICTGLYCSPCGLTVTLRAIDGECLRAPGSDAPAQSMGTAGVAVELASPDVDGVDGEQEEADVRPAAQPALDSDSLNGRAPSSRTDNVFTRVDLPPILCAPLA